jgi:hypothetical protein
MRDTTAKDLITFTVLAVGVVGSQKLYYPSGAQAVQMPVGASEGTQVLPPSSRCRLTRPASRLARLGAIYERRLGSTCHTPAERL